ncbi:hypothetical protein pah_c200o166 [Parachlamydia acanthamoebae str. Hall's coccus]|jgi:hypothetical protein|nr:hypothetical protein pah_c200o166 [Parachlamydia acanthamoebae str. Hall's coccus]
MDPSSGYAQKSWDAKLEAYNTTWSSNSLNSGFIFYEKKFLLKSIAFRGTIFS